MVIASIGDVLDEAAIDLQGGDREAPQVGQRAVPGAEVVDGDLDADLLQSLERDLRGIRITHDSAFRHLEDQRVSRQAGAGQRRYDGRLEAGMGQMLSRHIDSDVSVQRQRTLGP